MKMIYVIEDHQVIRDGIKRYLELSSFEALGFGDIKSAEEAIKVRKPDLIIQDVMLPDGDGFEFIERIRKDEDIPVVFLTAKIDEEDRIHGLELGADDYITKPFSPQELVLRVQAIFRRVDTKKVCKKNNNFKSGSAEMQINTTEQSVTVNGKEIDFTSAEKRVLFALVESGEVVSRSEILKKCFNYSSDSYARIVDTHIKNIRAKLGAEDWIDTIRGFGYRFIGHNPEEE